MVSLPPTQSTGIEFRLRVKVLKGTLETTFFTQRAVSIWSEQPVEAIEMETITMFKRHCTGTWIDKV